MTYKKWQVWKEDNGNEEILFTGSYTACKRYYKHNKRSKSGLHLGYPLMTRINGQWIEVTP